MGLGTPFISALELRPLYSFLYYQAYAKQSLNLYTRRNVGSDNSVVRYPDDIHDRLWLNYTQSSWAKISTGSNIDGYIYDVPSLVLQTAAGPSTANSSIDISWSTSNTSTWFLLLLHFTEIKIVQNTSLREFYVYENGKQYSTDPIPMKYLNTSYHSYYELGRTDYNVSLKSSPRATLPPILNAFELYTILPVTMLPTYSRDVSAIKLIKTSYGIRKDWNGDPCLPTNYSWTGIKCTIYSSDIPRITVLNLSSSRLNGEIISAFGYLTDLVTLDLSYNNLSGNISDSLDNLTSLTFLDLSGNSGLSGILPPGLQKKQNDHHLIVLFDGTDNDTDSGSGHKKSSKSVIIIIVPVVIVLLIVGALTIFLLYHKTKKTTPTSQEDPRTFDDQKDPVKSGAGGDEFNFNKKQLRFSELKLITNGFREKIGIGGFGEVFKGRLESGHNVAVKVCSESSSQGTQQFLNEVKKLSRVHHKNLVSLVGYCKDGNYIALIYEYMQEGNLKDRLRGLDYLHKMCNPPLIHRDVKTSNILLTRNLEAKVSDFGLVRAFSGTHVSTKIVGTLRYLDPHYASTSELIEKSDVYSFGVVLLEIITAKAPIRQGQQRSHHLTEFVQKSLSKGNIESILDPYMGGQHNLSSIWKVAELALRCTDLPAKRPDMTEVVIVLKESLNLERSSSETGSVASGNTIENGGNFDIPHIWGSELPDYGPSVR